VGILGTRQLPEEFALAAGLIYGVHWLGVEGTLELVKRIHVDASPEWFQHYGGEVEFLEVFAARLGYVRDQYVSDVTYGLGVRIPVLDVLELSVDYASKPDFYADVDFINGQRRDFWSFGIAYFYPE
jgi:hypothetical protein